MRGPLESQRGRRRAVPAVDTRRQSGGRPGAGNSRAERASTALSTSWMAAGGADELASQKPPRSRRDPGARPLKVEASGRGQVPTSLAPTVRPEWSRQVKTALRRWSA